MGVQKKKKNRLENIRKVSGSSVGSNVIISRDVTSEGMLRSSLGGRRLGSLVSNHLLVDLFQVQFLQINFGRVLDEVPPQKLETLEVLAE